MVMLQKLYREEIIPNLMKKFNYKSVMQVPRILKIVLNMGVGEAISNKKALVHAIEDLAKIGGQKPIQTNSRKSIAGFKIRAGWPLGCKLTLRHYRMYDFLHRLICIVIPRIRDFRGFNSKAFDGFGNYNLGIKEQIVFPEIDYDTIDRLRGLNITIVTSTKKNEEATALLKGFGFPLKD